MGMSGTSTVVWPAAVRPSTLSSQHSTRAGKEYRLGSREGDKVVFIKKEKK
jgi:hypothetical protein